MNWREDFDRWWVTATLQEKVSLALMLCIGLSVLCTSVSMVIASLRTISRD